MPDTEGRPIAGASATPVWLSGIAAALYDAEVQAMANILAFHRAVHDGRAYISSYKSPEGGDIADNGTIIFWINPNREIHLFFTAAAGGDAEIEVNRATTISGGTALGAYNLNQNHPDDAGIVITRDPTVTDAGTNILNALLPGGTGGNASGGLIGLRPGTEFELDEDQTYMIRLTNRGGGAKPMSLVIEYYEPP